MSSFLDKNRAQRALIENSGFDNLGSRLSGLIKILTEDKNSKKIVEFLGSRSAAYRIDNKSIHEAENLEEIAVAGFFIINIIIDGLEIYDVANQFFIEPINETRNTVSLSKSVLDQFIYPTLDYIDNQLNSEDDSNVKLLLSSPQEANISYPPLIHKSLVRFLKDNPDPRKTAFIMMQFGSTRNHDSIVRGIRSTLDMYGLKALRADDKEYHEDLFGNVQTYLYGCGFGIAVFERLENEYFNPNVSLEVGYMRALGKQVCFLKDKTLRLLQTDLVGKLYKHFDPQDPEKSIPKELQKWLEDKDIISL